MLKIIKKEKAMKKRVLCLFLVLLLLCATACGKNQKAAMESADSAAPMDAAMDAPTAEAEFYAVEAPMEPERAEGFAQNSVSGNTEPQRDMAEKIIYRGDMSIQTTEFDKSLSALEALVKEFGGFKESSNVYGNTEYREDGSTALVDRTAYYTLRIPCARFEEFLSRSGSLGNVLSTNTSAENITSAFRDTEARKTALETQETRILELIAKAEDMESLIALESRLSEIRYELDSLSRTLIDWQNQVDYSTVSVSLQEVAVYTPVASVQMGFGEKLAMAFSDGWHGFVSFLSRLCLWVVESLPALILLAVLVVVILLLLRKRKRRKQMKKEQNE